MFKIDTSLQILEIPCHETINVHLIFNKKTYCTDILTYINKEVPKTLVSYVGKCK